MKSYPEALHAMQTGVQVEMDLKGEEGAGCTPKHLRVGNNSAMVQCTAIVAILIKKGVITLDEYMQTLTEQANKEVDRYEEILLAATGKPIKLH